MNETKVTALVTKMGAAVEWVALRRNATRPAVSRFLTLADMSAQLDMAEAHVNEMIGRALDMAAARGGLTELESDPAVKIGRIALHQVEMRRELSVETAKVAPELQLLGVLI